MKTKEQLLADANIQLEKVKDLIAKIESLEEDKYLDLRPLDRGAGHIFSSDKLNEVTTYGESFIMVRRSGELQDKSFFLSDFYNWELKRDSQNVLCLIPTEHNS